VSAVLGQTRAVASRSHEAPPVTAAPSLEPGHRAASARSAARITDSPTAKKGGDVQARLVHLETPAVMGPGRAGDEPMPTRLVRSRGARQEEAMSSLALTTRRRSQPRATSYTANAHELGLLRVIHHAGHEPPSKRVVPPRDRPSRWRRRTREPGGPDDRAPMIEGADGAR